MSDLLLDIKKKLVKKASKYSQLSTHGMDCDKILCDLISLRSSLLDCEYLENLPVYEVKENKLYNKETESFVSSKNNYICDNEEQDIKVLRSERPYLTKEQANELALKALSTAN